MRSGGAGRSERARLQWAWLFVAILCLGIVGILPFVLLSRHHRSKQAGRQEAAERRARAQRESGRYARVTALLSSYLHLDATAWRERDRTLALILATTRDAATKKWARSERDRVAPYVKRLQIVERYNRQADRLSLSQETTPPGGTAAQPPRPPPGGFADSAEAKDARRSPHWKAYLRVREELRLRRGKYCCKIATGKLLFSRANSIKQCRRLSQTLCDALALTTDNKQKCFYTVTTACDAGEVVAVGDVEGKGPEQPKPGGKVSPK